MLDLSALERATRSLSGVLTETRDGAFMQSLTQIQREAFIAGAIQNFESTYELCWKFIKRWLDHNLGSTYVEGVSRRELFRLAQQSRLLDSVEQWMLFHRARNQTSRVYDTKIANEVFEVSKAFEPEAIKLLETLRRKND